jgi:hypothetical protein
MIGRVTEVSDNQGATFDRYTVEFEFDYDGSREIYALAIGPTGNAPNGVCMTLDPWMGFDSDETMVDKRDLPKPVRSAIANELLLIRSEFS